MGHSYGDKDSADYDLMLAKQLLSDFRKTLQLGEGMTLKNVLHKETQLLHMTRPLLHWEKIALMEIGSADTFTLYDHNPIIQDLTIRFFAEKMQDYFQCKLRQAYLTKGVVKGNQVHRFLVHIFSEPVGRKAMVVEKQLEDRLAGVMAKQVRVLNGRGPERIKVTVLEGLYIVYLIIGVIAVREQEYAAKGEAQRELVTNMLTLTIKDVIKGIHAEDHDQIIDISVGVDIGSNQLVALVAFAS